MGGREAEAHSQNPGMFSFGTRFGETASSHDHDDPLPLPSLLFPCLPHPLSTGDPSRMRRSPILMAFGRHGDLRLVLERDPAPFPERNTTCRDGGGGGGGGAGGLPYLRHPGRQRAARSYRHRQLCAERRRERVCVTPGKPTRRTI